MINLQNEVAKLNQSQRKALKEWFPSMISELKVEKFSDGYASVECVSVTGLYGYAFVGPRGGLKDQKKWS